MREIFVRLLIPYLGGVTHVAFPAGKLPDEVGVHQFQAAYSFQDTPDGMPVDAGTLHLHFLYPMVKEQLPQLFQLRG